MARMARFLTYGSIGKKKKSVSVHVFLFSLIHHNPKKRAIRAIHTSAQGLQSWTQGTLRKEMLARGYVNHKRNIGAGFLGLRLTGVGMVGGGIPGYKL